MARTVIRPKITVQAGYSGGADMLELFMFQRVNAASSGKSSDPPCEIVKDTHYNEQSIDRKEAG